MFHAHCQKDGGPAAAIQAHVEPVAAAYAPQRKWRWPRIKSFTIEISDDEF